MDWERVWLIFRLAVSVVACVAILLDFLIFYGVSFLYRAFVPFMKALIVASIVCKKSGKTKIG